MGCDCCKEISLSDYSKCQQDMVRILRNREPKSFRQYNAPCGESYTFGAKITMPKRRNVKIGDKTMTREEAKELLPIIQAFAEGKTIEICETRGWRDLILDSPKFNCEPSCYRIKPESKYRPFKTKEECWSEMLKHQPFGWLKSKKDGSFCCIGEVSWSDASRDVHITYSTSESLAHSTISVFNEYTFADGTPFGIKEE